MHRIIYFSKTACTISVGEMTALLEQARHANEAAGITGALVYGAGQFLQTIEGPQEAVEALYQRLLRDVRHAAVVKIADHAVPERTFPALAMTFREIPDEEMHQLIGHVAAEHLRTRTTGLSAVARMRLERAKEFVRPAWLNAGGGPS
jgi:hypothetical protein